MTTESTEIYDVKEREIAPAAVDRQPAAEVPVEERPAVMATVTPRGKRAGVVRPLRIVAIVLTWGMVATFLIGGGIWAFGEGMAARKDIWQSTHSIRFKEDISRGFNFGNETLRYAEQEARLEPFADAMSGQSKRVLDRAGMAQQAKPNSARFRRLSGRELMWGLVSYIDSVVRDRGAGEYDLDYPPLRLAVMTLWVRQVQREHPEMTEFPQQRAEDGALGRDEDVAEPLLRLNAYCAAAAAVGMFFLVLVWVRRSFIAPKRTALGRLLGRIGRFGAGATAMEQRRAEHHRRGIRQLGMRWTVPHGIFAFMLATGGFWYAYMKLAHVPATPAPMISVVQVQPGDEAATVIVSVNSQGQDTQWHVDYGSNLVYGHKTETQSAELSTADQQYAARLAPLKKGETVHLRLTASSAGGTSSTEDVTFVNDGKAIDVTGEPVGGIDWPSWSVWLRMLALFIAMVVSAQMLPAIHRGWACGAVAAMLVWNDPLLLIDSHAWPQWDVWILPFFVFAALMASLDWWMVAGILLGVGCMFKGQLLLAGPILFLWPLFAGRWGALARVIIGFAIGAEAITWPWLLNSPAAVKWVELALLVAVVVAGVSLLRPLVVKYGQLWITRPVLGWPRDALAMVSREDALLPSLTVLTAVLAATTLGAAVILHGGARASDLPAGALGMFCLAVVALPWFLRRRSLWVWLAGVAAAAVWIASEKFGGSYAWATLGYAYGSVKHDEMQMSIRNFSNLTSILSQNYQWDIHDHLGTLHLAFTTPGPWRIGRWAIPSVAWSTDFDLDVKAAMAALYGISLVISSAAAALHARRNDRRFLVALVGPWIVFPVVMCQMGDRYPIWASCLSAAMVAVSLELSLLHVLLAVVSFAMVAHQLLNFDQTRWPQLFDLMTPTYPGLGWMMVLIAGVFFVAGLVPSRREEEGEAGAA